MKVESSVEQVLYGTQKATYPEHSAETKINRYIDRCTLANNLILYLCCAHSAVDATKNARDANCNDSCSLLSCSKTGVQHLLGSSTRRDFPATCTEEWIVRSYLPCV